MNAHEINKVQPILTDLIHKSILDTVDKVIEKCYKLGSKPQEPDFIASLTIDFTKDFFNILKAVFPNNKFSITGVYCHQKPIVDIGLKSNPELGDLLLVYNYTDKHKDKKFNSILFQAKITNKHTTPVSKSDEHQLKLYNEWPKFTYQRAGKLNGTKRDILPKTINDGGQYLLIDDHPIFGLSRLARTFPMGCASPAKTLCLNNDLATELVDFLKFKSGRQFEEDPTRSSDDWTKMVWDLLQITKDKASKRRNSGINNFPRQNTEKFDGICFFLTESNSIYSDLHSTLRENNLNETAENFNDENNPSTAIILIENTDQGE
jgi:hypothetical protein